MKRFKFGLLGVGALAGMLALGLPATSAQAIGLGPVTQVQDQNSHVQTVQEQRRMKRRWNRQRHGQRFRDRRGNNRYYRDGYYYASPWWLLAAPAIVGGAIIDESLGGNRRGGRHVEWCSDRYQSYEPRNNTWVSFSGNVNQCDSPYN